jgi:hypothetical protein
MKRSIAAAALVVATVGGGVFLASQNHLPELTCFRAPLDGGTDCQRYDPFQHGMRYIGAGNVFPADAGGGSQCEPCECVTTFEAH